MNAKSWIAGFALLASLTACREETGDRAARAAEAVGETAKSAAEDVERNAERAAEAAKAGVQAADEELREPEAHDVEEPNE